MHGRTEHRTKHLSPTIGHAEAAVAWIDDGHAMVARTELDGPTVEVIAHDQPAETPFLARVVEAIGDRDRVLIVGPDAARLELEREYVAIYRRPDRIVDVEPAGYEGPDTLMHRLETLVGG